MLSLAGKYGHAKTILIASAMIAFAPAANAQLGAVIGAIGAGIAVKEAGDELRENVDHARAAAEALLLKGDDIAKRRLEQIDRILNTTVSGLIGQSQEAALEILQEATRELNELEQKIFSDLRAVIWDVECASKRTLLEDARQALGNLGSFIDSHTIRLSPPKRVREKPDWTSGCFFNCKDPYVVSIQEPFGETFIQVRDLMEEAISDEHVTDTTPAHDLVGTYEYLSALALKTSCFYPGSSDRWNREYIKYQQRAAKWRSILPVIIIQ